MIIYSLPHYFEASDAMTEEEMDQLGNELVTVLQQNLGPFTQVSYSKLRGEIQIGLDEGEVATLFEHAIAWEAVTS